MSPLTIQILNVNDVLYKFLVRQEVEVYNGSPLQLNSNNNKRRLHNAQILKYMRDPKVLFQCICNRNGNIEYL